MYWRCVTNPSIFTGRPGLVKIQHGCTIMRFTCLMLMDGLSPGIPEQSAFMGTKRKEIVGQLYILPLSRRRCSWRQATGGIEEGRFARAFRKRTLAHQERRGAILGQRAYDGPPKRKWGTAGLCESSARLQRASLGGREVAARRRARRDNARKNRPLPGSFQASLTILQRRMTLSSIWSVIAAKT